MPNSYLTRIFTIIVLLVWRFLSSTVVATTIVFKIDIFKLYKLSETKLSTTTARMSTTPYELDDPSSYNTFNVGIAFMFGFTAVVLCLLCFGFNMCTRCICGRRLFSTNELSGSDHALNTTQNDVNARGGAFVITYPDQPPPSYGEISKHDKAIPSCLDNECPPPSYNDLMFLRIDPVSHKI